MRVCAIDWHDILAAQEIRVGGATIDGAPFKTEPDSLTLIAGMRALAEAEPDRIFNFDTGTSVASFNAAAAVAFADAIGAWVQSTFDKRAAVLAAIEARTITTPAQVDEALT